MNSKMKYMCNECTELHDSYDVAIECCPTEIDEIYLCGHCSKSYGSDEDAANECCDDVDSDALPLVSHAELEDAGQIRLSL